jgi:hypothetical protein
MPAPGGAGGPAARCRPRAVGLLVRVVAVAVALHGGLTAFADAVEVVALGAVLPVVAFGGAELLGRGSRPPASPSPRIGASLSRDPVGGAASAGGRSRASRRGWAALSSSIGVEEGVLLEHLADFLVQFQRGQLQQADRLLQLGRERQVLREPDLQ